MVMIQEGRELWAGAGEMALRPGKFTQNGEDSGREVEENDNDDDDNDDDVDDDDDGNDENDSEVGNGDDDHDDSMGNDDDGHDNDSKVRNDDDDHDDGKGNDDDDGNDNDSEVVQCIGIGCSLHCTASQSLKDNTLMAMMITVMMMKLSLI